MYNLDDGGAVAEGVDAGGAEDLELVVGEEAPVLCVCVCMR
jgi:hypothetical protein